MEEINALIMRNRASREGRKDEGQDVEKTP